MNVCWGLGWAVGGGGAGDPSLLPTFSTRQNTRPGKQRPHSYKKRNSHPEPETAGEILTSCFGGAGGALYLNNFVTDASNFTHVPLRWVWTLAGATGGALLLLAAAALLTRRRGWLAALFVPKARVAVVHNPAVRRPVAVRCAPLDMAALRRDHAELAAFVDDLPAGMAIKGGVARRILKVLFGAPEPPGKYDIDCLVFLEPEGGGGGGGAGGSGGGGAVAAGEAHGGGGDDGHGGGAVAPAARAAAREAVSGLRIGSLVLEPQDCEVTTKGHLYDYFITRDVSLNEVLIISHPPAAAAAPGGGGGGSGGAGGGGGAAAAAAAASVPHLYYTDDAAVDAAAGTVRPGVHALRSDLALIWAVDDDGTPYLMARSVSC